MKHFSEFFQKKIKTVYILILFLIILLIAGYFYVQPFRNKNSHLVCLSFAQVTNKMTPVELYPSAVQCFKEGKPEEGIFLFGMGGIYSMFDVKRMKDTTKGMDVWEKLADYSFAQLTQRETRLYHDTNSDVLGGYSGGSPALVKMCKAAKRIGMPAYYPLYMVKNNMSAVRLVTEGELKKIWNSELDFFCDRVERKYSEVK